MTLSEFRDSLLVLPVPVSHYSAHKKPDKYIVWAEDMEAGAGHGDNRKTIQVIQGTLDYFTKTEFDPIFDQIQATLNNMKIAWRLNSVQHEDDTGYIHYEWIWQVV
jgi:hypothetical protein